MYDYSENKDTQKLFILNYQKQDDKIIIHFADGKKRIIPNTKSNEEKILMKMRGQIKNIDELKHEIQKRIFLNGPINIFLVIIILVCLYRLIQGNYNQISYLVYKGIPLINCFLVIFESYQVKKLKKRREELDKLKFLEKNEETLNTYVKMNENILQNTSKKTKDFVNNNKDEKVFTINSIDKLSLKDLKTIRDNISLEKEFDFEYSSNSMEKGAYTKKR